jgi:hypothetical protein
MGFLCTQTTSNILTGGVVTASPTEYTFAVWAKPASLGTLRSITNRTVVSGGNTHQIYATAANVWRHYAWDGSVNNVIGTTPIVVGVWYHVVITAKNGGFAYLYVNGMSEGTPQDIGTLWADGDRWYIGGGADAQNPWNGEIASLTLWNKQLTADEVLRIYNTNRNVPLTMHPSYIHFHFAMDDLPEGQSGTFTWRNGVNTSFTQTPASVTGRADILTVT